MMFGRNRISGSIVTTEKRDLSRRIGEKNGSEANEGVLRSIKRGDCPVSINELILQQTKLYRHTSSPTLIFLH
jgi:hypothetical protein